MSEIVVRFGVLAIALVAALVVAGQGFGAAASPARDCKVWVQYPNLQISSARNMSCDAAARELRRNTTKIRKRFHTSGGFYCYRVSGTNYGGRWRCVRGKKAFKFEFGD